MNDYFNPQEAADQTHPTYRKLTAQLGLIGLDTTIPEGVRALAEKTVGQTREVYDRSIGDFEASVATFERTFDAAGQAAAAFNRKVIDIVQRKKLRFQLRPGNKLGGCQGPRRYGGVAGRLLARANRRAYGTGRRSPCAFDEGDGRLGRADQAEHGAWRGRANSATAPIGAQLVNRLLEFPRLEEEDECRHHSEVQG